VGVSKCRWAGFGRLRTQFGETILDSGREDDVHQSGVAIVMTRYASGCLESWTPVSDRIITVRFYSKYIVNYSISVRYNTGCRRRGKGDLLQSIAEDIGCDPQTRHALGNEGLER